MKCKLCNKPTKNPKFCNRTCATSYNNSRKPKRKKRQFYCVKCEVPVAYRRTYCDECISPVDYTLQQVSEIKYKMHGKFSLVRYRARNICSDRKQTCVVCDYTKHVQVCHIKPIASFPNSAKLSEVNAPGNLALLCPNCHWELDNGHLCHDKVTRLNDATLITA